MITAVDTNIFLDILIPDAPDGDTSYEALSKSLRDGANVICEAVYAELAAHFRVREELDRFLDDTGIVLRLSDAEALFLAGKTWRDYVRQRSVSLVCPSCGASRNVFCETCGSNLLPRQHVLADFLIGAHAAVHADGLLTRDHGYYRTYFRELRLA